MNGLARGRIRAQAVKRTGAGELFRGRCIRRDYSSPIVTFLSFCSGGGYASLALVRQCTPHVHRLYVDRSERGQICETTAVGFAIQRGFCLDGGLCFGVANGSRTAAGSSHTSTRCRRGTAFCPLPCRPRCRSSPPGTFLLATMTSTSIASFASKAIRPSPKHRGLERRGLPRPPAHRCDGRLPTILSPTWSA